MTNLDEYTCDVTVGELETCFATVGEDLCRLLSAPACAVIVECST